MKKESSLKKMVGSRRKEKGEARTRSGIEAARKVRRIGSREKDWRWTANPEVSFGEEEERAHLLVDKHLACFCC